MADLEIFKAQTGEHMLKDKSFSSTDILKTGQNVAEWTKKNQDKNYEDLWNQHLTEMELFDTKLKAAGESKRAEDILVAARLKNLQVEAPRPKVSAEVKTIAGLLKINASPIEAVLSAALQKIGKIEDAPLKQIAANLGVTLAKLVGVVDVCKTCTSVFNLDTIKAVGQVQFFAFDQYIKDVATVHKGKAYGIDWSAGPATFMTIRTILEQYYDILDDEEKTNPSDGKGGKGDGKGGEGKETGFEKKLVIDSQYLNVANNTLTGIGSSLRIDHVLNFADAPDELQITHNKVTKTIIKGKVTIDGKEVDTYVYKDKPSERVKIYDGDKIEEVKGKKPEGKGNGTGTGGTGGKETGGTGVKEEKLNDTEEKEVSDGIKNSFEFKTKDQATNESKVWTMGTPVKSGEGVYAAEFTLGTEKFKLNFKKATPTATSVSPYELSPTTTLDAPVFSVDGKSAYKIEWVSSTPVYTGLRANCTVTKVAVPAGNPAGGKVDDANKNPVGLDKSLEGLDFAAFATKYPELYGLLYRYRVANLDEVNEVVSLVKVTGDKIVALTTAMNVIVQDAAVENTLAALKVALGAYPRNTIVVENTPVGGGQGTTTGGGTEIKKENPGDIASPDVAIGNLDGMSSQINTFKTENPKINTEYSEQSKKDAQKLLDVLKTWFTDTDTTILQLKADLKAKHTLYVEAEKVGNSKFEKSDYEAALRNIANIISGFENQRKVYEGLKPKLKNGESIEITIGGIPYKIVGIGASVGAVNQSPGVENESTLQDNSNLLVKKNDVLSAVNAQLIAAEEYKADVNMALVMGQVKEALKAFDDKFNEILAGDEQIKHNEKLMAEKNDLIETTKKERDAATEKNKEADTNEATPDTKDRSTTTETTRKKREPRAKTPPKKKRDIQRKSKYEEKIKRYKTRSASRKS